MSEDHPDGYYVRRVAKLGRYPDGVSTKYSGVDSLSADTIVQELKTCNNTLSWWYIPSLDDNELKYIISVIVSSFSFPIQKVHLAVFPAKMVEKTLIMRNAPETGTTGVINGKERHFDSEGMKVGDILWIADNIALARADEKYPVKIVNKKMNDIIKYMREAKIKIDDKKMNERLLKKINDSDS